MILSDNITLRDADVEECAVCGVTPQQAVEQSVANSTEAYIISVDGEPLAYWGFADNPHLTGECFAWMLSTPLMDLHRIHAARESLRILALLLETHNSVMILVDRQYTAAVRWLKWLGFRPYLSHGRMLQMNLKQGGSA